eukprot:Hpha_TRINITY_DN19959_c0_g1::TRINITY_DN19959_c0_g1_i1::g.93487::m.93487/K20029/ZDHHC3_7_25; palmitoyltransferase ZDHHC3/7/25
MSLRSEVRRLCRKMGVRSVGYYGTAPGNRAWFTFDCCGMVTACLTYFLVTWACFAVDHIVSIWLGYSIEGLAIRGAFFTVAFMALFSHFRAMTVEPGVVHPCAEPVVMEGQDSKRYCRQCSAFKPPRAHHDSVTGRCVVKMDHYCPWVNNTVGIRNHKMFILFIVYVFLISMMALFIVGGSLNHCMALPHDHTPSPVKRRFNRRRRSDDNTIVRVFEALFDGASCGLGLKGFFLVLEALLFGLFTFAMFCDQRTVLDTGLAGIDRRKKAKGLEIGQSHDDTLKVDEVFGGQLSAGNVRRFRLDFLWPSPPDFGHHHDTVMGFRVQKADEVAV